MLALGSVAASRRTADVHVSSRGYPEVEQQLDDELGGVSCIEFYPGAGVASRFDYYTGAAVVAMTGSLSSTMVSWQAGHMGIDGVLETQCRPLHLGETPQPDTEQRGILEDHAATQVMTIPLRGATSVQIGR